MHCRTWSTITLLIVSIGWPVVIPTPLLLGVSAAVMTAIGPIMVVTNVLMLIAAALIAGTDRVADLKGKRVVGCIASILSGVSLS